MMYVSNTCCKVKVRVEWILIDGRHVGQRSLRNRDACSFSDTFHLLPPFQIQYRRSSFSFRQAFLMFKGFDRARGCN